MSNPSKRTGSGGDAERGMGNVAGEEEGNECEQDSRDPAPAQNSRGGRYLKALPLRRAAKRGTSSGRPPLRKRRKIRVRLTAPPLGGDGR